MTEPVRRSQQEIHSLEQAKLQRKNALAAAVARSPGEWLDIYRGIVEQGVRQTLEENGEGDGAIYGQRMKEIAPHFDRVRRDFVSHGLPLLEDVEVEGARIVLNKHGIQEGIIFDNPDKPEVKFFWPGEGSKAKPLTFTGRDAIVAITFIQWWVGFHEVALTQDGQERTEKTRVILPGTPDYLSYLFGKN